MNASVLAWALTIALIVGLVAFDFVFHLRTPHVPGMRESAIWSVAYIGIAVLFGGAITICGDRDAGEQYFAGYLVEKSLSIDNMLMFLVVINGFAVPRIYQQKVLLFGIGAGLLCRTALIFGGVALIDAATWMLYVFGAVLIVTAGRLLRPNDTESNVSDNRVVRAVKKLLPVTDAYDQGRLVTVRDGRRAATPMLLALVAIGGTDAMFGLDSAPAIFGITQNPYLVVTATVFSMLGLRQLYFLIDGVLNRMIYLRYGLAAILGLVGLKLVFGALRENTVPLINHGQPVEVTEIGPGATMAAIAVILAVATAASLLSAKGQARSAIPAARRHTTDHPDPDQNGDLAERDQRMISADR